MTRFTLRHLLLLALAMLALGAPGCEQRVVGTSFGGLGEEEKDPAAAKGLGDFFSFASNRSDGAWTLALARFNGRNLRDAAEKEAKRLRTLSGQAEVRVEAESRGFLVCIGRYASPQDPAARRAMAEWARLSRSGRVPLALLQIAPLEQAEAALADFDLRSVAGQGHYTLQIGYFENSLDKAGAKRQAEQRVQTLRDEGVPAYFYHGPHRSMVTVGVFGRNAVRTTIRNRVVHNEYTEPVRQWQQKFPHNLENGKPHRETRAGQPLTRSDGTPVYQPSFLVRIPSPKAGGAVVGGGRR